jgi:hypothetical protein
MVADEAVPEEVVVEEANPVTVHLFVNINKNISRFE